MRWSKISPWKFLRLKRYDNALTLDAGKNAAFTNTASDIVVRLATDLAAKGMTFDYNGVKVGLTPVEGNYDTYLVVDDAVRYSNVFDGIDVQYTVGKHGVSEDIILTKEVEKNAFSYKLDLNGHHAELIDNVLFVYDKKGDADYAYTVSAPLMTDAAGISSENVTLSLDGDILTVTADAEWLHAVDRAYPVLIDPEIRIDSSIAIRSVVQDGDRVYVSAVPYGTIRSGRSWLKKPSSIAIRRSRSISGTAARSRSGLNGTGCFLSSIFLFEPFNDLSWRTLSGVCISRPFVKRFKHFHHSSEKQAPGST